MTPTKITTQLKPLNQCDNMCIVRIPKLTYSPVDYSYFHIYIRIIYPYNCLTTMKDFGTYVPKPYA
jgi:hypothetical protein